MRKDADDILRNPQDAVLLIAAARLDLIEKEASFCPSAIAPLLSR